MHTMTRHPTRWIRVTWLADLSRGPRCLTQQAAAAGLVAIDQEDTPRLVAALRSLELHAEEQEPDDEKDTDAPSEAAALSRAKRLREAGKRACAFERRNIRYPEEAPAGLDLPAYLYDRDDTSLEPDHAALLLPTSRDKLARCLLCGAPDGRYGCPDPWHTGVEGGCGL